MNPLFRINLPVSQNLDFTGPSLQEMAWCWVVMRVVFAHLGVYKALLELGITVNQWRLFLRTNDGLFLAVSGPWD